MDASNQAQEVQVEDSNWLSVLEAIAVVGSLGGSIAAAILKEVALAAVPLSMAATLNLLNRRQQVLKLSDQRHLTISHLMQRCQEDVHNEINLFKQNSKQIQEKLQHLTTQEGQTLQTLATLIAQGEQHESALMALQQQEESQGSQEYESQLASLATELDNIQSVTAKLQTTTSALEKQLKAQQNNSESLAAQTEGVEELVETLREIDALTQNISANPYAAENFYQRGLIRQQLQRTEDYRIAMEDFSQAIELNPVYAEAYYERGLLKAKVEHKQHAVDDLRAAAKYYFEQGNLGQYEKARSLAQEIHALIAGSPSPEEETEQYLLESLFG
ncbi:MAG: hypothetical protein HC934_09630 [Acaryochloridaceae cyanobacterium SU_2_1]|nr:hypothetical protein [Acaryochloridaceae cyanobacterium SU_2_1]NJM95029.1 hypothetical protein [Acaryochloridaceae cyanobacterium CSU_5_19]